MRPVNLKGSRSVTISECSLKKVQKCFMYTETQDVRQIFKEALKESDLFTGSVWTRAASVITFIHDSISLAVSVQK